MSFVDRVQRPEDEMSRIVLSVRRTIVAGHVERKKMNYRRRKQETAQKNGKQNQFASWGRQAIILNHV